MGNLFGTDGIRGKANDYLTVDIAYQIGRYCGYHYNVENKGKILIGRDTRLSGSMLEAALVAGITSSGCDVYLLGICATPCVAYLLSQEDFDCGIMISASHNVYSDNGIKVFMHGGVKISEQLQEEISAAITNKVELPLALDDKIGRVYDYQLGVQKYYDHLKAQVSYDLTGMKIGLDLANGSATIGAQALFESFGAEVVVIGNQPNGININDHCGSTHLEKLQALVKEKQCDVGFAFDGDADRMMAVDEHGNVVDGDKIMYMCALYKKERGLLAHNVLVTTQMSNIGLYKALKAVGIESVVTNVGDKYVYEAMSRDGYVIGGEQSGHIIFGRFANTGDGQFSALKALEVMKVKQQPLSRLTEAVMIYPQLLQNVAVSDKKQVLEDENLLALIQRLSTELGDSGRILVRASGTENLVRVMVEAETDELCQSIVDTVVKQVEKVVKV